MTDEADDVDELAAALNRALDAHLDEPPRATIEAPAPVIEAAEAVAEATGDEVVVTLLNYCGLTISVDTVDAVRGTEGAEEPTDG